MLLLNSMFFLFYYFIYLFCLFAKLISIIGSQSWRQKSRVSYQMITNNFWESITVDTQILLEFLKITSMNTNLKYTILLFHYFTILLIYFIFRLYNGVEHYFSVEEVLSLYPCIFLIFNNTKYVIRKYFFWPSLVEYVSSNAIPIGEDAGNNVHYMYIKGIKNLTCKLLYYKKIIYFHLIYRTKERKSIFFRCRNYFPS